MAKFFGNLSYVVGAGFALMIALMIWSAQTAGFDASYRIGVYTFLHVLCGIMWIGHLYYFNFTQIPTMPKVPAELKPAVSKYIAPVALWWFRWGAALTVLTGVVVAHLKHYLVEALTFQAPFHLIGIGMWLAIIMAINVWFVIWPAQKKALGLVEADADTKAKAATTAMMFSRTNTLLSVPMLFAMVMQSLGGAF